MTPVQRARQQLRDLIQEVLQDDNLYQTCLHCMHFNEPGELCNKVTPPMRPPARTIVFGCGSFKEAPDA